MANDMNTQAHVHVSPVRNYVGIFLALMGFTALTAWVAFQDFGALNDLVALSIAATKMTLVILFFMHVKYSSRLTKLTILSGFLWLLILLAFTFADYKTRGLVSPLD